MLWHDRHVARHADGSGDGRLGSSRPESRGRRQEQELDTYALVKNEIEQEISLFFVKQLLLILF